MVNERQLKANTGIEVVEEVAPAFKDGVLTKSTFVNTEKLYFKYFPKLKKTLLVQEIDGNYTGDNLFIKSKKQLKK